MKININGIEQEFDCAASRASLQQIWEAHGREREIESARGFAIALNGRLVRRAQWPQTTIAPGDRIEIVRALSGG
ncbi:sulfur carrier protein ThiS [Roseiarcaceae bacterium H3SJ34-1]|uniref:sulfur carrier protein ThiS n=1 Tax=Terripilifer ovatus TaxID=3032367 RepID=UPI003AB9234B|nr:sulfur carrier protein ThiS [Roseiarcaceae bacterium H3SJ34-1]